MAPKAQTYPEHEKLAKVQEESQTIGEFLEFGLPELGLHLAETVQLRDGWKDYGTGKRPTNKSITAILAAYFGIDQNKIEQEKREMLATLRRVA